MHLIKGTRLRKEVWIKPDGGRRLHRTTSAQEGAPDSEEAELKAMSTTDLNRRFNNAFLHLIGTLYTNINLDAFPMGCDLLQKEFRILLSRYRAHTVVEFHCIILDKKISCIFLDFMQKCT